MIHPSPDFPLDLDPLMPPGIAQTLTLAETGAFVRLARHSWREEPPCSLPDAPSALATVVGVALDNWPRLTRLVGAVTTRGDDGRLHLPQLRAVYDRLAAKAAADRSRTAAATAAAASAAARRRHTAGLPAGRSVTDDPSRTIRDGSVTDPPRIRHGFPAPSGEARARAERSAPERSTPEIAQRSPGAPPLSASSADVIARIGSAGARALAADSLRRWQHAQSLRLLSAALEQWRAAGRIDGRLRTGDKAAELAACEHAEPARCAAAIEAVRDAIARDDCRSAFGMLVGLLGAVRAPRTPRPMDVPLPVRRRWDELEAGYLREQAANIATAAAMQERRTAGGGPISATGA